MQNRITKNTLKTPYNLVQMYKKFLNNTSNPDLVQMDKLEQALLNLEDVKVQWEQKTVSTASVDKDGNIESTIINSVKIYKLNNEEIHFISLILDKNFAFQVHHQMINELPTKSIIFKTGELGTRYFYLIKKINAKNVGKWMEEFIKKIKIDGIPHAEKAYDNIGQKTFYAKLGHETLILNTLTGPSSKKVLLLQYELDNIKQHEFAFALS